MLKWLHRGLVCALTLTSLSGLALLAFCYFGNAPINWIVTDETGDAKFSRSLHQQVNLGRDVGLMQIRWYQGSGVKCDDVRLDALGLFFARISERHRPCRSRVKQLTIIEYTLFSISTGWATTICAIYPAIFFIRSYRRRRLHRQVLQPCTKCGYDLHGNESGVCPECGEAVEMTA